MNRSDAFKAIAISTGITAILILIFGYFHSAPQIHYEFIKEVRLADTTQIYWKHNEYRKDGTLYRECERLSNSDLDETYYSSFKDKYGNVIAVMEKDKGKQFTTYLLYRTYDKYGNWIMIEKVEADYSYSFYDDDELPPYTRFDKTYSVIKRDITYRD